MSDKHWLVGAADRPEGTVLIACKSSFTTAELSLALAEFMGAYNLNLVYVLTAPPPEILRTT